MVFLSNFVWIINVEGNVYLTNEQILDCCKKIGIYEGIAKSKINSKYDAQIMRTLLNCIKVIDKHTVEFQFNCNLNIIERL